MTTSEVIADLVIHGGTIVSPDAEYQASVAIKDGMILAIGKRQAMPQASDYLDATGLHILPGAIDVHVHFRDPGYPQKEDFASGTAAAAFGGVTTVFDMPNTLPAISDAKSLREKHEIASTKAHVDYGLYAVLGEESLTNIGELIDGGIIGFKCYMGNTFGRIPSPTTGAMLELFEIVAPTGKRISLHAETNSIMERREARLRRMGRTDPLAHLAARPAVVAVEAVERAATLAEWTGARIHILHISSTAELRPLADAKDRGVDITGETCPQYLLLSADDYEAKRGVIRVNPPVREAENNDPIWQALVDGTIDMIATDHAPHSIEEKTREDIWTVDCGFPGVETQMPLMLTEIARRGASLSDYVRWSAESPAKRWGLFPRKGALMVGSDADIAIVDTNLTWTIDDALTQSTARISPWHGMEATALPIHTIVRGKFAMKDRKLQEDARGWGRSVHDIQVMPPAEVRNSDQTMEAVTSARRSATT
ncbi:dihydroorotase family protein [Rhizobium sp. CFBP 8752]|uniref:dihydroorotase n=1 Tax=Rhizobium sp. CFBP 8752 TaxID=2775301 RepID=UPI001785FE52|nr:dihydroorotase family protein [Rhizobium sp. CFBP 8752]MBD8664245.1 dihydroorotase family protein [Rhizobium sp. CFBP 8752]